jgi:outer membrane lipoprotein SlyB
MKYHYFPRLMVATLALVLSACATQQQATLEIRKGVIEQITATQIDNNQRSGVGAVLGGVIGLGIGSLIGGGTGRDVAMVAGAIGGAVAGNEVQKKHDQPIPAQQIMVRTTSGVLVAVTQPLGPTLSVGQKVFLQGSGEDVRVTAQ